jgi:hypothetical protein
MLEKWLLLDQAKPLLYRKELIYPDEFGKLDSSGDGLVFEIVRDTLSHWRDSIAELRGNGITIPLTTSHDDWDKVENKLGEVIDGRIAKNKQGKSALFIDVKFDDEKSRDLAIKGDVSIGSPPLWRDGKKRTYRYPVQHVCSTAAPVIPGLETWQAIAAAFGKSKKGKAMDLDQLITLLGLEEAAKDAASDDEKIGLIKAKIMEFTGGAPKKDAAAADAQGVAASAGTPPVKVAPADDDDDEPEPKGKAKKVTATVAFSQRPEAPLLVKTVKGARMAQLDALVESRTITPAVKKELVLSHCTDEQVTLELSHGDDGKAFDDAIKLVKMMHKDRPMKDSGRSTGDADDDEVIELSHNQADSYQKFVKERYATK